MKDFFNNDVLIIYSSLQHLRTHLHGHLWFCMHYVQLGSVFIGVL